ncbi:hypothetical protein [Winogradskyella forsetii]|uniref:hypothetical protein n=1 Tax=Winogradskyella forsetii TaxID=2686077 RepID=UPI0015BC2C63|nr:hypothetical protein [Winogradskyella forsetii]
MNRVKKIVFLVIIAISANLFSQTKADALKDAKIASSATLNMDFETVLKHTLPSILEMMGGKDAALNVLKQTFNGMKAQGFVFEKADINGVSEIVKEQGQFRCVIESFNQMVMSGQRISSKSYLLGIYNEVDKYWWFLEAKQLKNTVLSEKVLPNFETQLDIPEDDMKL